VTECPQLALRTVRHVAIAVAFGGRAEKRRETGKE